MFGVGSIGLNVTAYNGIETSGAIDILCELSDEHGENSSFINIGIERREVQIRIFFQSKHVSIADQILFREEIGHHRNRIISHEG